MPEENLDPIYEIFSTMQINYTNLWTTAFPTDEQKLIGIEIWSHKLSGLTGDQIKQGLDNLPKFPPSPAEFRELCEGDEEHRTAAYQEYDRRFLLEKKHTDEEKERNSKVIRDAIDMLK